MTATTTVLVLLPNAAHTFPEASNVFCFQLRLSTEHRPFKCTPASVLVTLRGGKLLQQSSHNSHKIKCNFQHISTFAHCTDTAT